MAIRVSTHLAVLIASRATTMVHWRLAVTTQVIISSITQLLTKVATTQSIRMNPCLHRHHLWYYIRSLQMLSGSPTRTCSTIRARQATGFASSARVLAIRLSDRGAQFKSLCLSIRSDKFRRQIPCISEVHRTFLLAKAACLARSYFAFRVVISVVAQLLRVRRLRRPH